MFDAAYRQREGALRCRAFSDGARVFIGGADSVFVMESREGRRPRFVAVMRGEVSPGVECLLRATEPGCGKSCGWPAATPSHSSACTAASPP
jgi:hypothetical protein